MSKLRYEDEPATQAQREFRDLIEQKLAEVRAEERRLGVPLVPCETTADDLRQCVVRYKVDPEYIAKFAAAIDAILASAATPAKPQK